MTDVWRSGCCEGETCHIADCDAPAVAKVGESIFHDDPHKVRHNLTAYVCLDHFRFIMGPWVDRVEHFRQRVIENGGGPSAITHALLNQEFPHGDGPDNSNGTESK